MDNVDLGSLWTLRGSLGRTTVSVTDVVDGVNPVVIYSLLEGGEETGMASLSSFVSRYEPSSDQ